MWVLIYVLVIYVNGSAATATTMNVEFTSLERCQVAKKELINYKDSAGVLSIGCYMK